MPQSAENIPPGPAAAAICKSKPMNGIGRVPLKSILMTVREVWRAVHRLREGKLILVLGVVLSLVAANFTSRFF